MSELYSGGSGKRYYTSAQIRQMQKQMKKSYKKAERLEKKYEKIKQKEEQEAEQLLAEIEDNENFKI